ncbi:MAG TPA: AI-2E family transporter [Candidatus Binataceae bacterium]|nr:AI-2E family transporter [Candidatus Binataceae bacterium]HVB80851.1 AI-2E family transporter [Candidatus Binataceae bacterium]
MSSGTASERSIELWLGVTALVLLAAGCLLILRPFISAALWAAILCFTTWPMFLRLDAALGGRRSLGAFIATLALAAIIATPVVILGETLASNISALTGAAQRLAHQGPPKSPGWVANIPLVGHQFANRWNELSESSSARIAAMVKWLPTVKEIVLGGGRAVGKGIFQIILSLLIAFFLYRDGETAADRLRATFDRIAGANGGHLLEVAGATVRSVLYGVLGTALLQGVIAAVGFAVAGVPGAPFLGFVTFLVSAIPAGPLLVAAPAAFWLYRQEAARWAVFILIWGLLVSGMDNVVKPLLISRGGGTTPVVVVMLGVLGGAMAFGLIGLFLGPALLAVGYSLFAAWSSSVADP